MNTKKKNLPKARDIMIQNWEEWKYLNIKEIEAYITGRCQSYDREVLQNWINQRKYREKKKGGKSGTSLETGSTLGGKQVIFDFLQDDGSVGVKKGQLDAKEELKLAKGLAKEPREHKDPEVAAQIQIMAAQFEDYEEPKHKNQFDSPSNSQDTNSSGEKSKVIALKNMLRLNYCWKEIKLVAKFGNFQEFLKLRLDYNRAMSFLIIARKYVQSQNPYFAKAIAVAFDWLEQTKNFVPTELANEFREFFSGFNVDSQVQSEQDLRQLFKICRQTRSSTEWMQMMNRPYSIYEDLAALNGCTNTIYQMMQLKHFFTLSYFDFIDYVIQNPVLAQPVLGLLQILKYAFIQLDLTWKDALLKYSNIENGKFGKQIVQKCVQSLLYGVKNKIQFSKFLFSVEVALELNNTNDVKALLSLDFNSKEDLYTIIEEQITSMTHNQMQHLQLEEAKMDQETKQKEEKKLKDEEGKNQIQYRIQFEVQERKQYKEDLKDAERQLKLSNMTDQNQFKSKDLQALFERDLKVLPTKMKEVLEKLKLRLRAEQVIVLNMLLRSNKKFTIIQLGTGFGKSRGIVGPLSDAVRWATKMKSVVIVPTRILRATNQDYCISANQAEIELTDPNCIDTFYCTFAQFLQLQHLIPVASNIFVDEGHMYFKEKVIQVQGKAIVPAEVLKRFSRVYILSATFGGQQGLAELQRCLKDSMFIHSPAEMSQKDLSQVEVFGNMITRDEVLRKAIKIAKLKLKEYPIILFCKDDAECAKMKELFDVARIFGEGSNTAELLDIIGKSKNILKEQVILTTQKACVGIDFIFKVLRAFVILTEDANYLEELLQPTGRSSRVDKSLPLIGAILTSIDCQSIESLEKSLKDKAVEIKLFGKTARENMGMLSICPSATQKQQKKLQQIIDMFNANPSDINIKKELKSMKGFKEYVEEYSKQMNKEMLTSMIQKSCNTAEVKPIAYLLSEDETDELITLGKRIQRNQENDDAQETLQMKRLKLNEEQPLTDIEIKDDYQEMSAFQEENIALGLNKARERHLCEYPQIEEAKTAIECLEEHSKYHKQSSQRGECSICKVAAVDTIYPCSVCTFVFCGTCLKENQINNVSDEANAFQELMEINNQHQVDPAALQQKELEEAAAVFEKHGLKVPIQKPKGALSFISEKKAKTVVQSKKRDESKSLISRTNGGTQIGNSLFKKDGLMRGVQNWQCLACTKKTTKPELHVCV